MQTPPQATVRQFDPATRSGSVLFDDGSELPFDADAYDRGGLLNLRLGQRVRLVLREGATGQPDPSNGGTNAGSVIVALTIITLAFPPGTDVAHPGSTES